MFGIASPVEQISFAVFVGGGGYATISAFIRANAMRKFVNETDEMVKDIIAAKFRFTESEVKGAAQYLKYYRSRGKWLSLLPISFMVFEFGSIVMKKFNMKE